MDATSVPVSLRNVPSLSKRTGAAPPRSYMSASLRISNVAPGRLWITPPLYTSISPPSKIAIPAFSIVMPVSREIPLPVICIPPLATILPVPNIHAPMFHVIRPLIVTSPVPDQLPSMDAEPPTVTGDPLKVAPTSLRLPATPKSPSMVVPSKVTLPPAWTVPR